MKPKIKVKVRRGVSMPKHHEPYRRPYVPGGGNGWQRIDTKKRPRGR
jgi:hypothetical protein